MDNGPGLDSNSALPQHDRPQAPATTIVAIPSTPGSSSIHQFDEERSIWSFEGRISRGEFWTRMVVLILVVLGIPVVVSMVIFLVPGTPLRNADTGGRAGGSILMALLLVVGLPCLFFALWFSLATQVKRWHDVDKSGWMVLLNMIPYLGIVVVIVLGCLPGTAGGNRYGVDPFSSAKHSQDGEPQSPPQQT